MGVRKFRSKIDALVMALVCAAIVAPALAMLVLARPNPVTPDGTAIAAVVATVFSIALIGWMLLATHYTIDGNSLKIVSGPLRWHVPIDEIESVGRTRSLWSSPALSLDRLRICYSGGKSVMISPADDDSFIEALGFAGRATGSIRS